MLAFGWLEYRSPFLPDAGQSQTSYSLLDKNQPRSRLCPRQATPEDQYISPSSQPRRVQSSYSILSPHFLVSAQPAQGDPIGRTTTTALLGMKIHIILCCDRNVPRILGRRLYTWSDTAGIEVFVHCYNQIRFHNHFLFSIRGYGHNGKGTPPGLVFPLQKLFRPWGNLRRSALTLRKRN